MIENAASSSFIQARSQGSKLSSHARSQSTDPYWHAEAAAFIHSAYSELPHPIYKSGDKNDTNNYRPISILPPLSNILERIV